MIKLFFVDTTNWKIKYLYILQGLSHTHCYLFCVKTQNILNRQLSTVSTKSTLSYIFAFVIGILLSMNLSKEVHNNWVLNFPELHQLLHTTKNIAFKSHMFYFRHQQCNKKYGISVNI